MNCADRKENTSTQIACTFEIELNWIAMNGWEFLERDKRGERSEVKWERTGNKMNFRLDSNYNNFFSTFLLSAVYISFVISRLLLMLMLRLLPFDFFFSSLYPLNKTFSVAIHSAHPTSKWIGEIVASAHRYSYSGTSAWLCAQIGLQSIGKCSSYCVYFDVSFFFMSTVYDSTPTQTQTTNSHAACTCKKKM